MPCKCGNSVVIGKQKGCRVRYCRCGFCNHCHSGGFCPKKKTWYKQKGTKGKQKKRTLNQSHGGHGWIPGCNNHN